MVDNKSNKIHVKASRKAVWFINIFFIIFGIRWTINYYSADTVFQQIEAALDYIGLIIGVSAYAGLRLLLDYRAQQAFDENQAQPKVAPTTAPSVAPPVMNRQDDAIEEAMKSRSCADEWNNKP